MTKSAPKKPSRRSNRPARAALAAAALAFLLAALPGCGGGGTSAPSPAAITSSTTDFVLVNRASGTIGVQLSKITYGATFLEAALPSDRDVTLAERFYTSGRPAGVLGKIYDIQPDNLPFKTGTRLCLGAADTGLPPGDLVIVTGPNLDQPLESLPGPGVVCAALRHSSPYSLARAMNLGAKEYTIFGNLDALERATYTVKVSSRSENNDTYGSLFAVNIKVYCDFQCMESGEREFRFMAGQLRNGNILDPLPDDLFIVEHGTYPFWADYEGMPWLHLRNSEGTTVGGIAYLLAAEYVSYFTGPGKMASYIKELDPDVNSIQRFFYNQGKLSLRLFVEILRNEAEIPGMLKILVKEKGEPEKTYLVNRSTAAITKSWISAVEGVKTTSAAPGDPAYDALNKELLFFVYMVVGLQDTPDETAGNAQDDLPRYTPNQELFAVNVMNLLRGLGWHNLEAIEIYYRDRLELWNNSQF